MIFSSRGAPASFVAQARLALLVIVFLKVLAIALDHRYLLVVSCKAFPHISRADFAFAQDCQIKAAATARMKTFRDWKTGPFYIS